jgi:hypothetical protein
MWTKQVKHARPHPRGQTSISLVRLTTFLVILDFLCYLSLFKNKFSKSFNYTPLLILLYFWRRVLGTLPSFFQVRDLEMTNLVHGSHTKSKYKARVSQVIKMKISHSIYFLVSPWARWSWLKKHQKFDSITSVFTSKWGDKLSTEYCE